ncbi:MarR family winged helix-turn-helix transcriptional regulator [Pelagibius sp. Alg239-R121]|uniref:MarR family winged helix-turn-helix transcriptional regulator n=1 Tax=Pelagibius sp. Alg239-R121 TaxID=2993448 RepID=UPI0024A72C7D|nr:MarR family transcriptional regulator [Pelagibius sp. Alg239-R121]
MTKETLRTANLLGAAVLGLHDELKQSVEKRSGRAGEAPAALNAIGHQPGLSNDALSRLLGLTHTGTVRLIDRLLEDGLVERRSAARDKRGVALYLTAQGKTVRAEILQDREAALAPLVSRLSAGEQKTLGTLLGKLLNGVSRDDSHKLRICRLCDSRACKDCPILVPVTPVDSEAPPA